MRFDDDRIRSNRVMVIQIVATVLAPAVRRTCCCSRSFRAWASNLAELGVRRGCSDGREAEDRPQPVGGAGRSFSRHEGEEITIEVLDQDWGDPYEEEGRRGDHRAWGSSAAWPVLLRHMVWHPTEVSIAVVGEATALRLTEPDGTVTLASVGGRR
jgi:hypothetical protein